MRRAITLGLMLAVVSVFVSMFAATAEAQEQRGSIEGAVRDPSKAVLPGITDETRNRGIQIDGASGADNRFMIDGVDTTNS